MWKYKIFLFNTRSYVTDKVLPIFFSNCSWLFSSFSFKNSSTERRWGRLINQSMTLRWKACISNRGTYMNVRGVGLFALDTKYQKVQPPRTHLSLPTDIDFREVKHEPMVSPNPPRPTTCTGLIVVRIYRRARMVLRKSIISRIRVNNFTRLFSFQFYETVTTKSLFKVTRKWGSSSEVIRTSK